MVAYTIKNDPSRTHATHATRKCAMLCESFMHIHRKHNYKENLFTHRCMCYWSYFTPCDSPNRYGDTQRIAVCTTHK